jgi:hypothetical protein
MKKEIHSTLSLPEQGLPEQGLTRKIKRANTCLSWIAEDFKELKSIP